MESDHDSDYDDENAPSDYIRRELSSLVVIINYKNKDHAIQVLIERHTSTSSGLGKSVTRGASGRRLLSTQLNSRRRLNVDDENASNDGSENNKANPSANGGGRSHMGAGSVA